MHTFNIARFCARNPLIIAFKDQHDGSATVIEGRIEKSDEAELRDIAMNNKGLFIGTCKFGKGARAMLSRIIKEAPIECLFILLQSNAHLKSVGKAVRQSNSITKVALGAFWSVAAFKDCSIIREWDRVSTLCLFDCWLTGEQIAHIVSNTSINKLFINNKNPQIDPRPYLAILRNRPKFTTLDIHGVPIDPDYVKTGVVVLHYAERSISQAFSKKLCDAIRDSTSLKYVQANVNMGPTDVNCVSQKIIARNWSILRLCIVQDMCVVRPIQRDERALRDVFQWLLINRRLRLVCKDVQGIIVSFVRTALCAPKAPCLEIARDAKKQKLK